MPERQIETLNPRELAFCEFYTSLGEPSCGNASQAALLAGYSDNRATAWRLMQRPIIRKKIQELHAARMDRLSVNADRVLHDLENERLAAMAKTPPEIASAIRATELTGRFLAMFTDRTVIDETVIRTYTITEQAEARHIAAIRLRESPSLEQPQSQLQLPNLEGATNADS